MQESVLYKAKQIITTLRNISKEKSQWWTTPLINFTEPSVVILEWWHYNKKVTLHVSEEHTEYIVCGEGKDGVYKIQCGKVKSDKELRNVWAWLANVDLATELEKKSYSVKEEDAKRWRETIISEVESDFPTF